MILTHAGRYAVVMVGLLGLLTSIQTACTFNSPPPQKTIAKTDSGTDKNPGEPIFVDAATSDDGIGLRPPIRVYGYGYGYGRYEGTGAYGYGYGYGSYGYGYGYYGP